MSDETSSGDTPLENEQLGLLTAKDRAGIQVAATLAEHGLVTEEGGTDWNAIAELLYPVISQAVVKTPADRAKVGVTPVAVMEQFFPELPGPAEWSEFDTEDAEFHKGVYSQVQAAVFRVLSPQPDGPVQVMLAENGGSMVLCVMPQKRHAPKRAYVTRNYKCITEDSTAPAIKKAQRVAAAAAEMTAMAITRVPESAKWFEGQHRAGLRELTESATNTVSGALEAATAAAAEGAVA